MGVELMSLLSEMLADSPRGCWMLATTADETANGLTLTEVSSPPTAATIIPTVSTSSRDLDGVADTMTRASEALLDLGDVLTMEAWVQLDALPAAANVDSIIYRTNSYQMFIDDAGRLGLAKPGTAIIVSSTATMLANSTSAYHCVATKNGVTSKLYINGSDVTGTVTNQTLTNQPFSLYLGSGNGTVEWLDGRIQAAAIYPTDLSAARVQVHYLAGTVSSLISDTPMPIMGRGATW